MGYIMSMEGPAEPPTVLPHATVTSKLLVTWAIDDSEVLISDSPHTIIGALSFDDPGIPIAEMANLRRTLRLSDDFEFKWNSKIRDPQQREIVSSVFLRILTQSVGLVTIVEGRDKQRAAQLLVRQICDFHDSATIPLLIFDENIVIDKRRFRRHLLDSDDERVRSALFVDTRSDLNDLVQCADLFA